MGQALWEGQERTGQDSGALKNDFLKNDQKPSKSLKIATLAVRDYARSNRNEKLTLDKSSKYYFDSKNTIS